MIRVAIVEDEENYISVLREYLEQYKQESGEQIEVTLDRVLDCGVLPGAV